MPKGREFVDYEPVRRAGRRGVWAADGGDELGGDESGVFRRRRAANLYGDASAARAGAEDSAAKATISGDQDLGPVHETAPGDSPDAAAVVPGHDSLRGEAWSGKRGHALSFAGLFLFTIILYFRPYELISALSSLTSMAFWVAFLTLALFFPTQVSLEGNLTARPREVTLALLLCVTALLSVPLAVSPGEAWQTFSDGEFIKAVLMFVVLINAVRTERRLRGLLYLALVTGVVLSAGAINDYRAGNFAVEGYRVVGVLGNLFRNPNDMALHLVTMIPIALALFLSTRNAVAKVAFGTCAALLVAGLIPTFSRGGFLGLAACLVVFALKVGRRRRPTVMVVSVLVVGAFIALAPGDYFNRLTSIVDHTRDAVGSASARSELLWRSIQVALANPVFGVGMGNFHVLSVREAVSHNAYTQVASEMGFAAMALYVMFIVTPLRRLRQIERETFAARRASRFYYLAVGLQASLVGYMVSSFFASVAYQFYVYYLVGYAVALRRIYYTSAEGAVVREGQGAREDGGVEAGARRAARAGGEVPREFGGAHVRALGG